MVHDRRTGQQVVHVQIVGFVLEDLVKTTLEDVEVVEFVLVTVVDVTGFGVGGVASSLLWKHFEPLVIKSFLCGHSVLRVLLQHKRAQILSFF